MYMSGITDENKFDEFRKTITWEGHADKIRVPYLCVAGEAEELSPLIHSERLMATLKGPKQMVVYQESRHSVGNVPAANLGPFPQILLADWLAAACGVGEEIRVRNGTSEKIGRFAGLDRSGRLLLECPGGIIEKISAGDVFPFELRDGRRIAGQPAE